MPLDPRLGAFPSASATRTATRFVVWSTRASRVAVELHAPRGGGVTAVHPLEPLGGGRFAADVPGVEKGALYKFRVDGDSRPDPYARFLPEGVHGPAEVVDTAVLHAWKHAAPEPPSPLTRVVYELHVGTFTPEGTFAAAARRLPALVELGVNVVELMPVAAFPGERGWGYDGVALFAPHAAYGRPEDLCAFVDEAHRLGLAVILDVVYNHLGPSGNYLTTYSSEYFTEATTTWGSAPNYACDAMRRLVLDNARMWLGDYRFDGLRLDATHAIRDASSKKHIMRELVEEVRALPAPKLLFVENENNDPDVVQRWGVDGVWADDFHHQVRVTLTHEQAGYYAAYRPGVGDLVQTIHRGWLYEGQVNPVTKKPRGKSAIQLAAPAFVYCIQNHDQIGNRALGHRLAVDVNVEAYCAVSMLLLFLPMTPLLFMGQEWAASTPFLYFTDHEPELGHAVSAGRREEFKGFPDFASPEARAKIPDPQARSTFEASKLDWNERGADLHARVLRLYEKMIALRKSDPVLSRATRDELLASVDVSGNVLAVRRWHGAEQRLLLVSFDERPAPSWPAAYGRASWTPLLASRDDVTPSTLPPWAAVIFAGRR